MAFKATKVFAVVIALVIGGTRYMNRSMKRINLNNDVGTWDTKAKDGLRYTITTRSNETGGSYFAAHIHCTPKATAFYKGRPCSPPMHSHDLQDEEFDVLSGVLMLSLNGSEVQVPIGQKTTVRAGFPHTFWNGGSEPLELMVRLTPGVPDESFLEAFAGLSLQAGGSSSIHPMQLVLLFAENGLTPTEISPPLWSAVKKVLVPLAKLMGFRSSYPEYVTKAGQPLPVERVPAAAPEPVAAAEPAPEPAAVAAEVAEAVEQAAEVVEGAAGAVAHGVEEPLETVAHAVEEAVGGVAAGACAAPGGEGSESCVMPAEEAAAEPQEAGEAAVAA